jgi:hypothetical protein
MSAWPRKTRRALGVFGHRARPCAAPRRYPGRPACDGGRAGARLTRAVGAGPVARDEPPRAASGGRTALRCHPRPGDARVAPYHHHAPGARMCPALNLADPPRRLARSGDRVGLTLRRPAVPRHDRPALNLAPRRYPGRPACDGVRAAARFTRAVGAGPVDRDEPPRTASGGRAALRCHPRPGDARVAPCRHHAPGARMCPALDLADPPRRLARSGERGRPDPPTARGASSRPADPGAGAAPASRPRERCGGAAPLSMPIRETDEGAAGG